MSDEIHFGPPFPPTTGERGYDAEHERLARIVIRRHVAQFGWTCPGIRVPAHASRDLCADHIVPVSQGGENVLANYRALCRSCNTRRLHTVPKRCPEQHVCSQHQPTGSAHCCGSPIVKQGLTPL